MALGKGRWILGKSIGNPYWFVPWNIECSLEMDSPDWFVFGTSLDIFGTMGSHYLRWDTYGDVQCFLWIWISLQIVPSCPIIQFSEAVMIPTNEASHLQKLLKGDVPIPQKWYLPTIGTCNCNLATYQNPCCAIVYLIIYVWCEWRFTVPPFILYS